MHPMTALARPRYSPQLSALQWLKRVYREILRPEWMLMMKARPTLASDRDCPIPGAGIDGPALSL